MAEWLVVKTNSRNPPHQIGNGREKQRKNSIGSYCEQHSKKKITEEDGREEVGKASYGVTVFLLLPHAANFRLSS